MIIEHIYIPNNLDINKLLDKNQIKYKPELILLFIYYIQRKHIYDSGALTRKGLVYIHTDEFKSLYSNYKPILNWLIDAGVILAYNSYSETLYPRSYRLSDKYISSIPKRIKVESSIIVNKLTSLYAPKSVTIKKYKWLFNNFRNSNFEINFKKVDAVIENLYNEDLQKTSNLTAAMRRWERYVKTDAFIRKEIWFSVDPFGYRLHTNFTNIHKKIRELITIDRVQLGEIDISCSQPFFLLPILKGTWSKIYRTKEYSEDYLLFNQLILEGKLYDYFIAEYKAINGENSLVEYVESNLRLRGFNQLRVSGTSMFGKRGYRASPNLSKPWIPDDLRGKKEKDIIKTMIFNVLYGKHTNSKGPKRTFNKLFPVIWELIGEIKANGDKKQLVRLLQRKESDIILNKVCKKLGALKRKTPVFTIHDCVISTLENLGLVKEVMEEIILKETGNAPTLNVKNWEGFD